MDRKLHDIARQERLEYFRKWRKKNKDKVQKHNATYWEKRALRRIEEKNKAGGDSE